MNSNKKKRLTFILVLLGFASFSISLVLFFLKDNVVFFYTPTQLLEKNGFSHKNLRLGGLVKKNSVEKDSSRKLQFIVTDQKSEIKVSYEGVVPDLFREEQGVVVEGIFEKNTFLAKMLLIKHDEKYIAKK